MHRLQELVRMHRMGKSAREIARHLRMGRDTVRCCAELRRAKRRDGAGTRDSLAQAAAIIAAACSEDSSYITYLRSPLRGTFFYLYVVIDVWSRKIVGWTVHEAQARRVQLAAGDSSVRAPG